MRVSWVAGAGDVLYVGWAGMICTYTGPPALLRIIAQHVGDAERCQTSARRMRIEHAATRRAARIGYVDGSSLRG